MTMLIDNRSDARVERLFNVTKQTAKNKVSTTGGALQQLKKIYGQVKAHDVLLQCMYAVKIEDIYNIGGNNQPPNIEIVDAICTLLDEYKPESTHWPHQNLKTYVTDRPGHDRRYAMDISKIERELGWKPQYNLQQGLRKTVEWYLDNNAWIEAIRAQKQFGDWMNKNYASRGQK